MDDLPFDFTEYVSKRLGLAKDDAKRLLVTWLRTYEPSDRRPIRTLARTRARDLGEGAVLDLRRAG
jgi:hypothetical protein